MKNKGNSKDKRKNSRKIALCTLGIIAIFALPLLIVHLLFKWNSGVDFFVAKWSAGDALAYVGTMLTFIGTIALSYMALKASNKANELSQKVIDMELNNYKLDLRPFVLVSDWNAYEIDCTELIDNPAKKYIQIGKYQNGNALGLAIKLTNTSNSCITVQYSTGISRNPELNWGNAAVNQSNLKMILSPGESDEFVFYATKEFMEKQISHRVKIELILENRFSKRYKESFTVLITSLSNKVKTLPGQWYCHLFAQDYEIGHFDKDENGDPIFIEEEL